MSFEQTESPRELPTTLEVYSCTIEGWSIEHYLTRGEAEARADGGPVTAETLTDPWQIAAMLGRNNTKPF